MKNDPTPREMQIAGLIAYGSIDKEVADRLHISTETVRTHRKHFFRKTGCRNAADLTRWYLSHVFKINFNIKNIATAFLLALGTLIATKINLTGAATKIPSFNLNTINMYQYIVNIVSANAETFIGYAILLPVFTAIILVKHRMDKQERDEL